MVRSTTTRQGKVAVVVGGGSGHYPSFCGVVGAGFADGAVVGNVFTSPSTTEAYSVSRAAHRGAGVLLTAGNYAGDVMNFELAVERLRAPRLAHAFERGEVVRKFPVSAANVQVSGRVSSFCKSVG